MHELLAPLVHVIELDAIDTSAIEDKSAYDELMLESLDAAYIEHDAYALFSQLMQHAQAFYEVSSTSDDPTSNDNPSSGRSEQSSAIVERSKFIHEVCLNKVDPELAAHLTSVEVLPQIFLM
jgi:TBC1 domain family protein 5